MVCVFAYPPSQREHEGNFLVPNVVSAEYYNNYNNNKNTTNRFVKKKKTHEHGQSVNETYVFSLETTEERDNYTKYM